MVRFHRFFPAGRHLRHSDTSCAVLRVGHGSLVPKRKGGFRSTRAARVVPSHRQCKWLIAKPPMDIEPKDSEGCAAQDGTRSSELIGTVAEISPARGVLFPGLRRATTATSLPTGAGPRMSELRGQDLRPADQRCDRGGASKSAVLRLEVIQDLRDQTGLDGLRRRLQGTGMPMEWQGEGRRKRRLPRMGCDGIAAGAMAGTRRVSAPLLARQCMTAGTTKSAPGVGAPSCPIAPVTTSVPSETVVPRAGRRNANASSRCVGTRLLIERSLHRRALRLGRTCAAADGSLTKRDYCPVQTWLG